MFLRIMCLKGPIYVPPNMCLKGPYLCSQNISIGEQNIYLIFSHIQYFQSKCFRLVLQKQDFQKQFYFLFLARTDLGVEVYKVYVQTSVIFPNSNILKILKIFIQYTIYIQIHSIQYLSNTDIVKFLVIYTRKRIRSSCRIIF